MCDGNQHSTPDDQPGATAPPDSDLPIELGPLIDIGIGLLTGIGELTAAMRAVERELASLRGAAFGIKLE